VADSTGQLYHNLPSGQSHRQGPTQEKDENMTLTKFDEQNVVFAANQPEYLPLPAFRFADDPSGRIACCWKLNWVERLKILLKGRVWQQVLTFNHPLQPQLLSVEKPALK